MKNKKIMTILSKIAAQGNVFMLEKNLKQHSEHITDEILNNIVISAILNTQASVVEYLINHHSKEFLNIFNTQTTRTPLMTSIAQYHNNRVGKVRTNDEQLIIDLLFEHTDLEQSTKKEVNLNYNYQYKKDYEFPVDTIKQDALTTAITHLDFDMALKIIDKGYNANKYYSYSYYGDDSFGNPIHYILDFVARPILKLDFNEHFENIKKLIVAVSTNENIFFNDNEGVPAIFSIAYYHRFTLEQKQDILLEIFKNTPILLKEPLTTDEIKIYSKLGLNNAHSSIEPEKRKEFEQFSHNLYSLIEKQILEQNISLNTSSKNKIKI